MTPQKKDLLQGCSDWRTFQKLYIEVTTFQYMALDEKSINKSGEITTETNVSDG